MTVDSTDEELRHSGYQPELKRTLGGFQVFAISFAFISVLVAIFATYGAVLNYSGPVGIWLWIVAAIGQTLVALVVAQFAARIALTGSSYQWASRLANPKVGWFFGWLTFWFLAIGGVVAMNSALASQALMPLLGMAPDEGAARLITLALMLAEAVLVIASTTLLGKVTSTTVGGLELVILAVLILGLGAVMVFSGSGTPDNLVSQGVSAGAPPNYFAIGGGLTAGMIMGADDARRLRLRGESR